MSLASGLRVAQALRSCGHTVTAVDTVSGVLSMAEEAAMQSGGVMKTLPPELEALAKLSVEALPAVVGRLPAPSDADVVFLGLHGGQGEDGTIQALLDLTGVPYTGSGHLASALAMDKDLTKHLFRQHDVPTADWLMAPATDDAILATLGLPVIVKPPNRARPLG